jgi:hypothetical protein
VFEFVRSVAVAHAGDEHRPFSAPSSSSRAIGNAIILFIVVLLCSSASRTIASRRTSLLSTLLVRGLL